MPTGRAPQELRRESFDLLGDGPTLPSTGNIGIADKDLMGAEDLTTKITSESGELASLQNQVNNLTNVTGDLQAKRVALEKNITTLSAQKQDISIRLNQIKTLHESEKSSIKDLEGRMASIQPQLIKLREELQVSERELSIARANKDEFLLSLARDQEESNQIRNRLRQNNEEIARLREELEAKKKDTNRQKGLLEINRRQLATSEADKQRLINEIAQESEKAGQASRGIQSPTVGPSSSPVPSSASIAPPVPAPRGSRKEPPPPPASRGTVATSTTGPTPEEEDAFGIPEALRSPTGSFSSVYSPRMNTAPATVSRQSTGSSPFDPIPRQGTGSSPFESISRQATGSSPFETIPRQGTGMSGKAPSITHVGESGGLFASSVPGTKDQDDFWSSAALKTSVQPETTMFTGPDAPLSQQQDSPFGLTKEQTPATSLPSMDPFGSMAFPAIDTPPVTKVDFDAAFQGLPPKPSRNSNPDEVKSAEAFAAAFPDIESVEEFSGPKTNRVSAFGFEDDFSGVSPFAQTLEKSKEEDEFPPIVQMTRAEEDSSDDSDDDNEEAFVQAKSSITSPESSSTPVPVEAPSVSATGVSAPQAESEAPTVGTANAVAPTIPPVAPVSTGSSSRKLNDFSEFESTLSFGEPTDDFESAFNGVELTAPKVSGGAGTGGNMAGFDDAFDFNASFDDAFGSSSPFGASTRAPNTKPTSSNTLGASELDEVFGGFGVSTSAGTGASPSTGSNAFSHGFSDFENEFFSGSPSSAPAPAPASTASPRPVPAAAATVSAAKTTSAAPSSGVDGSATMAPAPPQVQIAGIEELINMGFTRQQAESALIRYDTVERAANFLLEGGQ